ncbi:agip53 [Agrotis ipsilon multiple nucleopolyhedrovirus]|uniref:Uncharacterized protein n=1 Tax=Agrotis ipsilon multiple nucleopolyhedrovirus TaxID=208013 RepID=B6D5W7_9ABAC|nr:agip53 [Agrotis ipsilon multiple nucleopolyhedrovirus]ACI28755.1 unknown [Agrotis ipsilon multiple nucleopolyhedrovirus]
MAEYAMEKLENFPSEKERLEKLKKRAAESERFQKRAKLLAERAANGGLDNWVFEADKKLSLHSCKQCAPKLSVSFQKNYYWNLMSRDHLFPELAPVLCLLLEQTRVCPYACKHLTESHHLFCKPLQCDPACPVLKSKDLLLADYLMQVLSTYPHVSVIESIIACKSPNSDRIKVPLKHPVLFDIAEASDDYAQSVRRLLQSGYTLDFDFMYLCHLAEVRDFNIGSLIDVLMEHDREHWLQRYDFYALYKLFGLSARYAALKAEAKERNICRPLFHLVRSPTTFFLLTDIEDDELLNQLKAWWAKLDSTLINCYTHALKRINQIASKNVMMGSLENVFERLTEYALFDGEHEVVAKFRQHVKGRAEKRTVSLTLCTSINKVTSNKHKFKLCLAYLLGIVSNDKLLSAWFESGFDTADLDYFFDETLSHSDILNRCKVELASA